MFPLNFLRLVAQRLLGAGVGVDHGPVGVEQQNGIVPDAFDQRAEVLLAVGQRLLGELPLGDVHHGDHRPVNLLFRRHIGPYTEGIIMAFRALRLDFFGLDVVNRLLNHLLQVRNLESGPDVANGPSDVGRDQIQHLFCFRRKKANPHIAAHQEDAGKRAAEHVPEVACGLGQFLVAVL